jgi:4-hydroxy-tetrahydrodipicolinate reductase
MSDEPRRVSIAGATGWTGRPVAEAVLEAADLELVSAVARSSAGQDLGTAWGGTANGVPVHGTVAEALENVDVLVDYTSHAAVGRNVREAVERRVAVVVGASGLSGADDAEIDALARRHEVGVVAAGNFSVTAAMAQAAAALVARHLPTWEIIDYGSATKADAPSGTARELAERLATVHQPDVEVPVERTAGEHQARGATVGGAQVHSLRLPSFVVSTEVVFALPDERLSIRHDAGSTPQPYVSGTLLAVRAVGGIVGLVRGLDTLLLASDPPAGEHAPGRTAPLEGRP